MVSWERNNMRRDVSDLWYLVARMRDAKGDKDGARRARVSARALREPEGKQVMINGLMTTAEVSARTGATIRQLGHWVGRGWINPVNKKLGTREPLLWRPTDVRHVRFMVQLINAGFTAGAAHDTAVKLMESWPNLTDFQIPLSANVRIRVKVNR